MAKQRFRDVKQGKISHPVQTTKDDKTKKNTKINKNLKVEHATAGLRFKAFVTDSFLLVLPLIYIVFYLVFGTREEFAGHRMLGWLYILMPLIIIQVVFLYMSGQTPGMRAYNLMLMDSHTRQRPLLGVIIYRQMVSLLTTVVFGWITMFFRRDHRTLHDLLSRTTLVSVEPKEEK